MSRHATLERLSAYLDDALDPRLRRQLASHLAICRDCCDRLAGLRRAVIAVGGLERFPPPPPPQRAMAVARDRFGLRLPGLPHLSPVFFSFALVMALTAVNLFAHGIEVSTRPWTEYVLVTAPELPEARGPEAWGQVSASREAAGRVFDLVGDVWRERGVGEVPADSLVEADSAAGRALLATHPDLAGLGDRVLLRTPGGVVELRRADRGQAW